MTSPATWAVVVLGHALLIAATLLWASQRPLRAAGRWAWPEPSQLRPLGGLLGLYAGVIGVHLVGVLLDPTLTAWVGRDYAQTLYNVEGDAVATFQAARNGVLDAVFLVAYMFGYPFMIYFAPLFYLAHRDRRALRLAGLAFVVLYALTLPFYVFFPASNPWAVAEAPWYQGRDVEFRLGVLWPDIVDSYWRFTTPNNEMPSLHAAISAMTAMVAWAAGYRRFALVAGAFAVLIPVASFYMGVHWLLDAVVGESFAIAAVATALRVANRFESPLEAPTPAAAEADG